MITRPESIPVMQGRLKLPCFFPSISSVKTNLRPIDYLELLGAVNHPLFLFSAFDYYYSSSEEKLRFKNLIELRRKSNCVVLMDSGNYEGFWRTDRKWTEEHFQKVSGEVSGAFSFCFDNQSPGADSGLNSQDVVARVLRNQTYIVNSTVLPIVHDTFGSIADTVVEVARQLRPPMIAVPERCLGDGISNRAKTVAGIRKKLNELQAYVPLHLLGTGNPVSIMIYSLAGADSFDGLEWCQTSVNHRDGKLSHFQHWDFLKKPERYETLALPYDRRVLASNLDYMRSFMLNLEAGISTAVNLEWLERATSKAFVDGLKLNVENA